MRIVLISSFKTVFFFGFVSSQQFYISIVMKRPNKKKRVFLCLWCVVNFDGLFAYTEWFIPTFKNVIVSRRKKNIICLYYIILGIQFCDCVWWACWFCLCIMWCTYIRAPNFFFSRGCIEPTHTSCIEEKGCWANKWKEIEGLKLCPLI